MSGLELELGSVVGHFRLERKLGEGGMGVVYLAEDLTLSRKVAIKLMSRSVLANQSLPEVREVLEARFIREAKSAGLINHPNVCQIYEADFESDDWYIAMEYIHGKDLVELREDLGQFTPTDIVDVCRQIAIGLRFAWDNYKIIHRDIKPQNIMVTEGGVVKIVDLGLAKPIVGVGEDEELSHVSKAGTAVGTPQYMAPEQATGETNIDYMVDIYAMGTTLYEMCTGRKAFNERSETLIYVAQVDKKYRPIQEFRTDLPADLISLIDDMLEPQRADRIGSYGEILNRLRTLCVLDESTAMDITASRFEVIPVPEPVFKEYTIDQLILDRYRVMSHLEKSPCGVAYRCWDILVEEECAVKSLFPGRGFSTDNLLVIQENYQKLKGIVDPNLVQILDVRHNETTDELLIIMEQLHGLSLREYIQLQSVKKKKTTLHSFIPVFHQIAEALDRLNGSLGMPHYDIKPDNIFIQHANGEVKLLDYGITIRPLGDNAEVSDSTLEHDGDPSIPFESIGYMAPERFNDPGKVTVQGDMYSLGIMMFSMLAGRHPFDAQSADEYKRGHCRHIPPTVHSINPDVTEPLSDIVSSLLAKNPEARFTPSGLVAALSRLEAGQEPEFPAAFKSWMKHPAYHLVLRMERNLKQVVALLLVGGAVLGTSTFFITHKSQAVDGKAEHTQDDRVEWLASIAEGKRLLSEHGSEWNAAKWKKARAGIDRAESLAQDKKDKASVAELRGNLNALAADRRELFVQSLSEARKCLGRVKTYGDVHAVFKRAAGLVLHLDEQKELDALKARYRELERKRSDSFVRECEGLERVLKRLASSNRSADLSTGETHYALASDLANSTPEQTRVASFRTQLDKAESARLAAYRKELAAFNTLLEAQDNLQAIESELGNLRQLMRTPKEKAEIAVREANFLNVKASEEQRQNEFAQYLNSAAASLRAAQPEQSLKLAKDAQSLARSIDEKTRANDAVDKASKALGSSFVKQARAMEEQLRYNEALQQYRRASQLFGNAELATDIARVSGMAEKEEARAKARRMHKDLLSRAWACSNQNDWETAVKFFREALVIPGLGEDADTSQGLALTLTGWASSLAADATTDDDWKSVAAKAEEALKYEKRNPIIARQLLERAKNFLEQPRLMIRAFFAGKEQDDVPIYMDGKLIEQNTPATLRRVAVGTTHRILANAGENFMPYFAPVCIQRGVNTLNIELVACAPRTLISLVQNFLPVRPGTVGKSQVSSGFWIGSKPIDSSMLKKLVADKKEPSLSWSAADEFCRLITEREHAANRLPPGCVVRLPTIAELQLAGEASGVQSDGSYLCWDRYDGLADRISCTDPVGPAWGETRTCLRTSQRKPLAVTDQVDVEILVVIGQPLERKKLDEVLPEIHEMVQKAFSLYNSGGDYSKAAELFAQATKKLPEENRSWAETKLFLKAYIQQCRAYAELSELRAKYLDGASVDQKISPETVRLVETGVRSIVTEYAVPRDTKYKLEVEEGILNLANEAKAPERPRSF